MGLFDKLFNKEETFLKTPAGMTIYAPLGGKVISLKEVPDPVFSEGILGPGCGIEPISETVCAPFHGTVTQITDTKHAIGVTSDDGMEVLIHVGMDTVCMNGKGFALHVEMNQKVKKGDKLLSFSIEEIHTAGFSTTTAVILCNANEVGTPELVSEDTVKNGAPLMKAHDNS